MQHRDPPGIGRIEMRQALRQAERLRRHRHQREIALQQVCAITQPEHVRQQPLQKVHPLGEILAGQRRAHTRIVRPQRRERARRGVLDQCRRIGAEAIDDDNRLTFVTDAPDRR